MKPHTCALLFISLAVLILTASLLHVVFVQLNIIPLFDDGTEDRLALLASFPSLFHTVVSLLVCGLAFVYVRWLALQLFQFN